MSQKALLNFNRAKIIARTLGTRSAAGFLRNREVPLEEALAILVPGAKVRA